MTQDTYLELLLNDVGFDTRIKRNAWISRELGREVRYLDELNGAEKHKLIDSLKERKQDQRAWEETRLDEEMHGEGN